MFERVGAGCGSRIGVATAGAAALGTIACAIGTRRWERSSARAVALLYRLRRATNATDGPTRFTDAVLEGLPSPVARYFEFALTPGQPLVRSARLEWDGDFRLRAWRPFHATQHVTIAPPGFVWDARIRMAPLLSVRVRDGYLEGEGMMSAVVGGLVRVVDQRGTNGLNAGALSRWAAEAVWFPTALLPGRGLSWLPVDDGTCRATVTDGALEAEVDFHFGSDGEIVRITMMREREAGGTFVSTPWEAVLDRGYRRVDGMMVPVGGEAAWLLRDGRLSYWRGRLVSAEFEYAE
jgi:hypothetical protein